MAEDSVYYPFDSGPGAVMDENQWADMAMDWAPTGVRQDTTDETTPLHMQVVQTSPGTSRVAAGKAKIRGFHYSLNSDLTLTHDANSVDGKERTDLVCVTLDMTGTTSLISITIQKGAEAAPGASVTPVRRWGATTGTSGIYDLPLAKVAIQGTAAGAAIVAVTSLRVFLPGGISPVYYGTYPVGYDGQLVFDRDNRRYQSYNPSKQSWETIAEVGPWKTYTPSMVNSTQSKYAIRNGRYKVVAGSVCHVSMFIKAGGSAVSDPPLPSLPFAAAATGYSQTLLLYWRDNSTSEAKRIGLAEIDSGMNYCNRLQLTKESPADLDFMTSLGSNDELRLSGSYEIAV